MFLLTCVGCGERGSYFDAKDEGWQIDEGVKAGKATGTCLRCLRATFELPPITEPVKIPSFRVVGNNESQQPTVQDVPPRTSHNAPEVISGVQGFDEPEDGSQERYEKRKTKVPWAAHAFWWWVHNIVAHPLIGILPKSKAFKFHDWTSRKMHGK